MSPNRLIGGFSLAFSGLLVFTALTLAVAGCGGGAESASTTAGTTATKPPAHATPKAEYLVARSSDFPDGYTIAGDVTGPTTLAGAVDAAASRRHAAAIRAERVAGYEVTAENPDTLQGIYCDATVYRSVGGAERVFRLGAEDAPAQADKEGWTLERTSIEESLGDETVAFVGSTAEGTLFTILWRDGQIISQCGGVGIFVTEPPLDDTIRVARAQQERIAEALA
jgi:hypothetical protein